MKRDDIESHWNELLEVINSVENRDEFLVIIGDTNRHLGSIIPGNNDKVSYGGELIKTLLETEKYVLMNASEKLRGGIWTRIDPADADIKSVLDLVIVSTDLMKYVESLETDSSRKFTPFKRNNDNTLSFPDHFAILLTLKGMPLMKRNKLGRKPIKWNTN